MEAALAKVTRQVHCDWLLAFLSVGCFDRSVAREAGEKRPGLELGGL